MYMTRTPPRSNIRMFCPLGPRDPASEYWWPDVAYHYVCALRAAGLEPRVVPIGGMQLGGMMHVEHDRAWRHWKRLGDDGLFTRKLADRFVNIVCAPVGLELGGTLKMGDFGKPPQVPGRDPGAGRDDEVVRQGSTAFASLWAEGMVNVAIAGLHSSPASSPGDPKCERQIRLDTNVPDLEALRDRYSVVICPTMRDVTRFEHAGVNLGMDNLYIGVKWYPPARFAVDAAQLPCFAEVIDAF